MNNKEIKTELKKLRENSEKIKQAKKIIEEYEKEERKKFHRKEIKHLKGFEGKYYRPRNNLFEKVTKVDDDGNFFSEQIEIDFGIKKCHTIFGDCRNGRSFETRVGGTQVPITRNKISKTYYEKVETLVIKFYDDLKKLKEWRDFE